MPLYQYKCRSCDFEFEEIQGITEEPIHVCQNCSKPHAERVLGNFRITGLTETAFLRDTRCNGSSIGRITDPIRRRQLLAEARKAGVNTSGKEYHPELAMNSVHDAGAWIGSVDDIKQLCKHRGWRFGIKDGNVDVGIPPDQVGPFKKKAKGK